MTNKLEKLADKLDSMKISTPKIPIIQAILDTLRSPIKEIALEFTENETILYICTKYKEKTENANLK